MKLVFDVPLAFPVERVFPYLAEPEKWLEWTPALVERTLIAGDPSTSGAVWRSVDRVGPFTVEFTDELMSIEENRKVRFKQSSPWNSWGELTIRSDGDGCVAHVHFEGKPTGKIRWLDLIPDTVAAKMYRKDYDRLVKLLEDSAD